MEIITAKQGYIYIVGYIYRPGCLTFTTELEHTCFPPNTELNELFNIYMVTYTEMMFNVVEIPKTNETLEHCYSIANSSGLRLVPGKPWNGKKEFPVNCKPDACFTLETAKHSKYANQDLRSVIQKEAQEMREKYNCEDD